MGAGVGVYCPEHSWQYEQLIAETNLIPLWLPDLLSFL